MPKKSRREMLKCFACGHLVRGKEYDALRRGAPYMRLSYESLGGKHICPDCRDLNYLKKVRA